MKNLLIPTLLLLLIWSCNTTKQTSKSSANKVFIIDSTEYEIIIIDLEFDTWYLMNYSATKDHSNEFYRSKNQIGVGNWNDYFNRGRYGRVVENYIYCDYSVNYGIEVNRKLYWYFKYIEENYKIRLLH